MKQSRTFAAASQIYFHTNRARAGCLTKCCDWSEISLFDQFTEQN